MTCSPTARICAWSSASSREQARSCWVTVSSPVSPSIRRSSAAARSPAASRASAAAPLSSSRAASSAASRSIRADRRVLAAAAEHVLDAPRDLRRALGRLPHAREARRPGGVGRRVACLAQALERRGERLADPLEPGCDRVGSGLGARRLGELVGERAERSPPPVERHHHLPAAGRQRLGAHREALVRGAHGGQPAPGLGALALALGELGLDRRAALGHDAELRVELGARLADLRRVRLGGRDLVVVPVQLGRQQARPHLGGLALEAGVDVGGLGLALERAQRLARLALDVERPVEVVLGALELELGAPAALAVLAESGGLLDEQAAVAGRREHDLLHPALADHRVHLAPEVRVGEDLDHVREPRASAVDAVRALAPALEPPGDRRSRRTRRSPSRRRRGRPRPRRSGWGRSPRRPRRSCPASSARGRSAGSARRAPRGPRR